MFDLFKFIFASFLSSLDALDSVDAIFAFEADLATFTLPLTRIRCLRSSGDREDALPLVISSWYVTRLEPRYSPSMVAISFCRFVLQRICSERTTGSSETLNAHSATAFITF